MPRTFVDGLNPKHYPEEALSGLRSPEVVTLEANASKDSVLEVDFQYLNEFHDAYNNYPLAPEHLKVKTA